MYMTKHCGLRKFWITFVAALVCLTLAAPLTRADVFPPDAVDPATLQIGDGVTSPCYRGGPGCFAWDSSGGGGTPDELTLILGDTVSIFQNKGGAGDLTSPVLVIFGVPVENLLFNFGFGGEFNDALDIGNILGTALYKNTAASLTDPLGDPVWEIGDPNTPVTTTLPDPIDANSLWSGSWPLAVNGDYVQGTEMGPGEDLYSMLGLLGPASQSYENWAQADVDVPGALLSALPGFDPSDLITPSGFMIFAYLLDTSDFDAKDALNIETTGIPIGTFVAAWGADVQTKQVCSALKSNGKPWGNNVCLAHSGTLVTVVDKVTPYSTPLTRGGLLMPIPECLENPGGCRPPEVPEPTSLLLLGTGLLAIGRQWRKRAQSRKQNDL
jgi:hypothetical protein